MRSKSPIRVKRSRSTQSNPNNGNTDIVIENSDKSPPTTPPKTDCLLMAPMEESAIKIQINDDRIDPDFDGTVV